MAQLTYGAAQCKVGMWAPGRLVIDAIDPLLTVALWKASSNAERAEEDPSTKRRKRSVEPARTNRLIRVPERESPRTTSVLRRPERRVGKGTRGATWKTARRKAPSVGALFLLEEPRRLLAQYRKKACRCLRQEPR